jgi:Protein of unknown function (DUF2786)
MLPKERAKILKLLALTASSHDGEALAASRIANKLLRRAGETWPNLIVEPTEVDIPPAFASEGEEEEPLARSPTFGKDPFGDGAPRSDALHPCREQSDS